MSFSVSILNQQRAAVLTVALRGLHKQHIPTVRHVLMHKLWTTADGLAVASAQAPKIPRCIIPIHSQHIC